MVNKRQNKPYTTLELKIWLEGDRFDKKFTFWIQFSSNLLEILMLRTWSQEYIYLSKLNSMALDVLVQCGWLNDLSWSGYH